MQAPSTPISIRLKPETREALRKAAEGEVRSQASLIEWVLRSWLENRGYLPKRKTGRKQP